MITVLNIVFLVWAVAMLPAAYYFWKRGIHVASSLILVGSVMIFAGQAIEIYGRTLTNGG